MAFYRRAFLYLWRKRGKSLLLLLIFLFVNTMILSTSLILRATEETKATMQEKTKSKVVCEIAEAGAQITAQDLEQIASLPHVVSLNRLGEDYAFLSNAVPLTASGSEEDENWMVKLSSFDELEYDSPFVDRPYKLTEGDFLTADSKNSAIVHADFAEKNGLAVGDEIGVEINGGKSISLTITGLYRAGNERKQDEDTLAVHRIENQVFIDNTAYTELFGEDDFYKKYEQKIKLLTDKFMPPRDEDEHLRMQKRKEMEQYADYRNYLSFSMYEQVTDENGRVIRENFVDDMAGRDSGGEGQNPKYVALLAGFAMLYMQQSNRDSKIKLVLLDEAFSKMDQERSAVCLKYARKMDLQLIVCVPDERLQSLIRNVDCVYGFRRHNNQISMMHIDKGDYLKLMEG